MSSNSSRQSLIALFSRVLRSLCFCGMPLQLEEAALSSYNVRFMVTEMSSVRDLEVRSGIEDRVETQSCG